MKFTYVDMGQATMVDDGGQEYPVKGSRIYGVKTRPARNSDIPSVVLGLVQSHPTLNDWRAVASYSDGVFPAFKPTEGLGTSVPGRTGFTSRKEASVWLLGTHDARQPWFTEVWE